MKYGRTILPGPICNLDCYFCVKMRHGKTLPRNFTLNHRKSNKHPKPLGKESNWRTNIPEKLTVSERKLKSLWPAVIVSGSGGYVVTSVLP